MSQSTGATGGGISGPDQLCLVGYRSAALARPYLASAGGRFDDAISILNGSRRELENVHNLHWALRAETHLAIVRFKAKQVTEALKSFGGVVAAFAQAGLSHAIVDENADLGPLLAALQENAERTGGSGELMSYVSNMIGAWRSRYQSDPQQTPTSAILESLSAREGDILKLIAEGCPTRRLPETWPSPRKR